MLSKLSCFNSQLLRAAAPKVEISVHPTLITFRLPSNAVVGRTTNRRSTVLRYTATQAAAEDIYIGETAWNKDLVNCISIIGRLAGPLEFKNPAYRVASGAIAVNNGKARDGTQKPPTWLNIDVWDDLADAAKSLRKGEQVQVLGKVKREEYTGRDGTKRLDVKITANQINRINDSLPAFNNSPSPAYNSSPDDQVTWEQPASQEKPQYAAYDEDQTAGAPWGHDATPTPVQAAPGEERWVHLVQNFDKYFDNRKSKRTEKAPDFKMKGKENDVALWLNRAPAWVHKKLEELPPAPTGYN